MERFYEPVFPQYLDDDSSEPVPGWGVNPLWAGPRMIAVGADADYIGSGDQKILDDAALAQQQATALAAQMKAGAKANPLYYVGGAAALGLLAFAVAPQGKGIIAGVIGAALGAVGAHFALKALTPKGGLIAAGTSLPAGSGVTTPPGSVEVPTSTTPSADTTQPVLTKDSSADTKPITTSSTPNADTPRTVVATPPAASYADNLKSCQALVDMGGGQTNLADCMRNAGTPLVASATNSGLIVSPDAAAAMLATQSPGYAAGQALQAQMQAQAAATAAAQAKAAWVVQAALQAAQAQRDGAARAAAAAAAAGR